MNLRELEYFVAVAELRHFGNAAKKLHVSQPTLSMQLKKLENVLGAPLFERSSKEVRITEFGERALGHAKEILNHRKIISELGKLAANPFAGNLHIGVFPTLAPYFLPPLVPILKKSIPELTLYFHEEKTASLIEKLLEGKIDAAFMALPINNPRLESHLLFEEEFLLAVSTEHPFARRKTVSSAKLKDENLLLLEDGHCFREQALEVCDLAQAQPNTNFSATSIETLLSMVAAGSGITLVPRMAAQGREDSISFIPFSGSKPTRSIALVSRTSSHRKDLFEKISESIRGKFPV